MIAFKTFSQCPVSQRPMNAMLDYPWVIETCSENQAETMISKGWTVMSDEAYASFISEKDSALAAWISSQEIMKLEKIVSDAKDFAMKLMIEFASENILMGITQENKTGEVLEKLSSVMPSLQAGSLYEAINQIRAIPPEKYDDKYITEMRLLAAVNKIEFYLGMPLSESL